MRASCLSLLCALVVVSAGCAYAQQRGRTATREVSEGRGTITVRAGDDLQRAINDARPGDTIYIEAGAVFTGPFTLPRKSGDAFVTIRTLAPDASLPAANQRVSPSYAVAMPKLVSPGQGQPALETEAGAHHYRLLGLEIKPVNSSALVYDLVRLGGDHQVQKSLSQVANNLVIDRCYIHGDPAGSLKRGIALNSASTEIINSYISEFKVRGQEAQAIMGWNGPGPFKIVNNYLEGAGENVMFGGADPGIPNLVPSDIEIRRNHFSKPVSWRGAFTVKNLFELKNAQRVTVDSNLFEYNWADAQEGVAILFTVRNQDGTAPWSVVQDVTFTNNIVRHSSSGLYILGKDNNQPSQQVRKVTVRNNLFEDINGGKWGGRGFFMLITESADVVIENNTILQTANITGAYGQPTTGFVFRNNIVMQNEYGLHGDNRSPGTDALDFYFPRSVFSNNAIVGGDASQYRGRNMFPVSLKQIKFVNPEAGDYRLSPESPLRRAGAGGADIGANLPPQMLSEVSSQRR
ncbi:MAG TPA: right-handed parallel beta-helix repeat-containing protein [Pyrinomonadaceae bacterium]|nr:right-handed parallel beta-helix repeat-containing protein [Pyrinomonadaceae bacterium]